MHQVAGYRLWLGHAGDIRDLSVLHKRGITAVVDLAVNEPPAILPREMAYCRIPLVDGAGNPPWRLRSAVELTATLLENDVRTLIICGAGLSRTPAIAAAAIARLTGGRMSDALELVTAGVAADVSTALWADLEELMGAGD